MAAAVMIPTQQQAAQQLGDINNSSPGRDDTLADAPYKCIACRMVFETSESQRNHYKLEFHRFNLKRKVAGLPPIQQEVFDKKINEIRSKQVDAEKPAGYSCKICNKQYTNENTLKQHLQSKKHLEQASGSSAKAAKKAQSARRVVNATKLAEEQQKTTKEVSVSNENITKEEQADEAPSTVTATSNDESNAFSTEPKPASETDSQEKPEGQEEKTPEQIVEEKIKLGLAVRLSPDFDCLFCREKAPGLKVTYW